MVIACERALPAIQMSRPLKARVSLCKLRFIWLLKGISLEVTLEKQPLLLN